MNHIMEQAIYFQVPGFQAHIKKETPKHYLFGAIPTVWLWLLHK